MDGNVLILIRIAFWFVSREIRLRQTLHDFQRNVVFLSNNWNISENKVDIIFKMSRDNGQTNGAYDNDGNAFGQVIFSDNWCVLK